MLNFTRKSILLLFSLLLLNQLVEAQSFGIGEEKFTPDASAILELRSNQKGVLIPRMTEAERLSISNPAEGLLVYDTDNNSFWYNAGRTDSVAWEQLITLVGNISLDGATIINVGNPVDPQDAATKYYVDSIFNAADTSLTNEIQGLTSVLNESNDAGNQVIANVSNPVDPQDAATKSYVDSIRTTSVDTSLVNEIQNLASVLAEGRSAAGTNITNLANPINAQDAATKIYVDNLLAGFSADTSSFNELQDLANVLSLGTDADGNQITNLANPQNAQDATTKFYVDSLYSRDGDQSPLNELQDLIGVLARGRDAGGLIIQNAGDPADPQDLATKNYVDNISTSDADADSTNEIQDLQSVLAQGTDANGSLITNLRDPLDPQDAATKAYIDNIANGISATDNDTSASNEIQDLQSVLAQGTDANGSLITNLRDPLDPQDAATKAYIDNIANGISTTDNDTSASNEIQDLQSVLAQGTDANGSLITNLRDPLDPQDAATKAYIDNITNGITAADNDTSASNEIQDLQSVLAQGADANASIITNIGNPINPQDATSKSYVDNLAASLAALDNDTSASNEIQDLQSVLAQGTDANGSLITNLRDPLDPQDAATKAYVDAVGVNDADADSTNELISAAIMDVDTLKITDAGGTQNIDLSQFNGPFTVESNIVSNRRGDPDNNDFVFGGEEIDNQTGVGDNARFAFDKSKAAWRAGFSGGIEWNDDKIGLYSTVTGGQGNQAPGTHGVVGGGFNNVAGKFRAFVGGGENNTILEGASGGNQVLVGGFDNNCDGESSTIGGGRLNSTRNQASVVSGGQANSATKPYATVSGGRSNVSNGDDSYVGGGNTNTARGNGSTISGGANNIASGTYSTIAGGENNNTNAEHTFLAGSGNVASANFAVALGSANQASGLSSSIPGGVGLQAESYAEAVLGSFNTDYAPASTVAFNAADRLFVLGNGLDDANRSDALIVFKDGNATLAGILTQNSDKRLKRNIQPLEGSLGKITQLQGVSYKWNSATPRDTNQLQIGLIAQEIAPIFPELVSENQNGYLSVNYISLVPVLIEALKDQQEQIESLQEQNQKLQSQSSTTSQSTKQEIESLRAELESIKQFIYQQAQK